MSLFDAFKRIESQPAGKPDFLIVGLGNPGLQYENTRHNTGFLALDAIAKQQNAAVTRLKFKGLCGDVVIGGVRCLLLKPTTYMNNSGEAVVAAMQYYKIPIERVLVLYDDISLDPGRLRIRQKGSAGGHNGIKSIIELTGEDTFPRIKLGVGKKPHPDYNLADWVLSKFEPKDLLAVQEACAQAANAAALIAGGNIAEAMNRFSK